MSKDSKQPSSPQLSNKLRALLLFAALCFAVGAGLYAFLPGNGNIREAALGECSIDDEDRKNLDAAAQGDMAAFRALDRPYSVADLSFKNSNGKPVSIADWKGRTVLFNLWATWCAPCRKEMPALDALQKDLGGDTFEVVPVSVDLGSDEKPKDFYQSISLENLGFYHDPELNAPGPCD